MIIDISSYNGKINFEEMAKYENIEGVILRATTKNGELDTRFIENINGAMKYLPTEIPIECYKFSYARTFAEAVIEANNLIAKLKLAGAYTFINRIWLDLEKWGERDYTKEEAGELIAAYSGVCHEYNIPFGIYCNYYYLKNVLPDWAAVFNIWLAKWSNSMGLVDPYKVIYWQFDNAGRCAGIKGNVDLSRVIR